MASRKPRPEPRWKQRLAAARTPEQEFAASKDAFLAALSVFARDRRDAALSDQCKATAEAELRAASAWLQERAQAVYDREREIRNALRRNEEVHVL